MFETSQASSCDYSMSQFRPDESSFAVKSDQPSPSDDEDDDNYGNMNGPSNSSAANASIKHELNDDEDDEEGAPIVSGYI